MACVQEMINILQLTDDLLLSCFIDGCFCWGCFNCFAYLTNAVLAFCIKQVFIRNTVEINLENAHYWYTTWLASRISLQKILSSKDDILGVIWLEFLQLASKRDRDSKAAIYCCQIDFWYDARVWKPNDNIPWKNNGTCRTYPSPYFETFAAILTIHVCNLDIHKCLSGNVVLILSFKRFSD